MDHQEIFSESVTKHFAYLIEEFGFSIRENQYHPSPAACEVAFQNKTRYVKLLWDLKDAEFYFYVFRVLSNGKPAPYRDRGTDQFYISNLAKYFERGIDVSYLNEMKSYNPDVQLLNEKIRANAQLLRNYGKDILAGRQWFDQNQNKLIPEAAFTDRSNMSFPEQVSRPLTGVHREPGNANRAADRRSEAMHQEASNKVPLSDRRSISTSQPIDSKKPLPMWMSLLIVGGISLCIGAVLLVAFLLLLRA